MATGMNDFISEYELMDENGNVYTIKKLGKIGSEISQKMPTHGSWICIKNSKQDSSYLVNEHSYDEEHESEEVPTWVREQVIEMYRREKHDEHAPPFIVFRTPHDAFLKLKTLVEKLDA